MIFGRFPFELLCHGLSLFCMYVSNCWVEYKHMSDDQTFRFTSFNVRMICVRFISNYIEFECSFECLREISIEVNDIPFSSGLVAYLSFVICLDFGSGG